MLQEILANKRLLTYLFINVAVSALTTLLVITIWMHFTLVTQPVSPFGTSLSSGQYAGQLQISAVVGAGDVENERVTLDFVGAEDVSLSGWRLRDENANEYRFPALVLHPGAQVSLFTKEGDDNVTQLFWDRQASVWTSGELVSLLDPTGQLQATYSVP
jgi:hypothetical protein